ncbi:TetR/AcrR family transcriptional regulator [Embleya sp. NPDC020630]|uniref:TetR/AcrR family transcriptional regulator n=1 Tax=Embleya sp. NPDC020630 TaxID=3363979 RepID=UPI00379187B6
MARPRKFDEEQAVQAALDAFWRAGYEATSTQDLCDATGLGRSSIYNTFSSKRELFLRALRRYIEHMTSVQVANLESDRPVRDKIRDLLTSIVVDETDNPGDRRGCLVVNTAIELSGRDAEVTAVLERDYRRRHAAIKAAIDAGRLDGDIDRDKDADALAHAVIGAVSGIRLAARNGVDRAGLTAIAETTLAAL